MKHTRTALLLMVIFSSLFANAGDGYKITGKSGVMYLVAIDSTEQNNEDVYRYAVGEACAGEAICQVQYWVGSAPNSFPLNDSQVDSKLAHWQQNLNTGLRRWLVKCNASNLFANERECM